MPPPWEKASASYAVSLRSSAPSFEQSPASGSLVKTLRLLRLRSTAFCCLVRLSNKSPLSGAFGQKSYLANIPIPKGGGKSYSVNSLSGIAVHDSACNRSHYLTETDSHASGLKSCNWNDQISTHNPIATHFVHPLYEKTICDSIADICFLSS